MSFDTQWRWAAFPPEMLGDYPAMLEAFGEVASDGRKTYATLVCGWDDEAHTKRRAMSLTDEPPTVGMAPLIDGRLCVGGLWTLAIVAAWQGGALPQVEELTEEQFEALRVKGETL